MPACWGPAGGVFLGRVRPARVAADLFRRPRRAGRRPHQERVRPRHSARRRRAVLRPGLFPAAARRDGWQHEDYIDVDHRLLPMQPAIGGRRSRSPSRSKPAPGRSSRGSGSCRSAAARCSCSTRTSRATSPEDRELTARLYGGDQRMRIRQELLLGVGGVRALARAGHPPGVVHLNEGHSAFAALELIRQRMDDRGHRRLGGDPPRRRRRSCSPRTRRCRPATIASAPT